MTDIAELLRELLDRYSNTHRLDAEFERLLREQAGLMDEYKLWCDDNGYSLDTGYRDYVNEIVESQDSIWDNTQE